MAIKAVFVPLARTTFYMPSAEENFSKSVQLLKNIFENIKVPDSLITEPSDLSKYLDEVSEPDLIIYQCTTFIGSEFMYEIMRKSKCPVLIWATREPSIDGTRLKLNSLTGAFSAGNSVYTQNRDFDFIFGNPDEDSVVESLTKYNKAITLINSLKELVIGVVGNQPAGFGFGNVNETDLIGTLGSRVARLEAAAIMDMAKNYTKEEVAEDLAELNACTINTNIPDENMEKYARLHKAFKTFVDENNIGALASRCWPDFFTGFGAPVCAVLSILNDNNIAASCETDIGGAISMFIGSKLTEQATYFGDPVAIDEECDSIVYWHCGAGASTLANKSCGAKLGVHPNRKIGPVMDFGLKSGEVTVIRLGKDQNGYRMFMYKGEALDEPQKFYGTSVTVKPQGGKAAEYVKKFVNDGWEPHFVVVYGDITKEIEIMCKLLKIRLFKY